MGFTGQPLNDQDGPVPHSATDLPLPSISLFNCSLLLRLGNSQEEGEVPDASLYLGTLSQGSAAPSSFRHLGGSTRAWEDAQRWASLEQLWLSNL